MIAMQILIIYQNRKKKSCYFSIFSSFQTLIFKHLKNEIGQNQQWSICCIISSFKKGGKIQTGLNCEYDGLSKVILSLSHSSTWAQRTWPLLLPIKKVAKETVMGCDIVFDIVVHCQCLCHNKSPLKWFVMCALLLPTHLKAVHNNLKATIPYYVSA